MALVAPGVGVGVGVGVGFGVDAAHPLPGPAAQLPMTTSVPPRVPSRLPFAPLVKVWPRRPASTLPLPMAPFVANGLSLAVETLMVMVFVAVSIRPQSALPREV